MLVGAGRLGTQIANELLKRGDSIKIMVRDPSKIAAFGKRGKEALNLCRLTHYS